MLVVNLQGLLGAAFGLLLGAGHVCLNWSIELLADRTAAASYPGRGAAGAAGMHQRMELNRYLRSLGVPGFRDNGDPASLHALSTHPPLSLRVRLLEQS